MRRLYKTDQTLNSRGEPVQEGGSLCSGVARIFAGRLRQEGNSGSLIRGRGQVVFQGKKGKLWEKQGLLRRGKSPNACELAARGSTAGDARGRTTNCGGGGLSSAVNYQDMQVASVGGN